MSEVRSTFKGLHGSGDVFIFNADQVPNYDTYKQLEDVLYMPHNKDREIERRIELLKERVLQKPPSRIVHPPTLFGKQVIPKRLWQYLPSRNIITTVGRGVIGDVIIGEVSAPDYGAVGSDDGTTLALAAGNTALGAETERLQVSINGSRTRSGTTITFSTFLDKGSGADGTNIEESGILDAAAAGNLVARGFVIPVAAKDATNTVTTNHRLGW